MRIYCFFEKNDDKKGLFFPIFKRSTSIHKNNTVLVVSIVLQKQYFYGIRAFSKNKKIISHVLVRRAFAQKV